MQEKMRNYLNQLFASLPTSAEVQDAKEELYAGMLERYNDCLAGGMEEQEAYENVIDEMGDLHELFDELKANAEQDATSGKAGFEQGRAAAENIGDFISQVSDFASGLVSGLFSQSAKEKPPLGEVELVNTCTLPLAGIRSVEISYTIESIELLHAPGDDLIIKEYMNRNDSSLFASVSIANGSILVRNGQRKGFWGLRSRVEIYLPESYAASLSLSTVSGFVRSRDAWNMGSFQARAISGEVAVDSVSAMSVKLSSTSGAVKARHLSGNLELHSISGSVRVDTAEGGGNFKTTSGGVRVNFTELRSDVDASSVSGGVQLGLPGGASFEFDARSISGSIHTGFDDLLSFQRRNKAHGFIGAAPFYHVRAASTSGSIHVND